MSDAGQTVKPIPEVGGRLLTREHAEEYDWMQRAFPALLQALNEIVANAEEFGRGEGAPPLYVGQFRMIAERARAAIAAATEGAAHQHDDDPTNDEIVSGRIAGLDDRDELAASTEREGGNAT